MPHIGNKAIIRKGDIDQFLYIARMTGPHFHDSKFVSLIHSKEGERNTNLVIEVSLRIKQIVLLLQDSRHQFFSSCFAVCTRNADDSRFKRLPMQTCNSLKHLQTIVDQENIFAISILWLVDNSELGASRKSI